MNDLSQRAVLVLGLGESGVAMARWCHREGACVRAVDTRTTPPPHASLPAEVDVRLGSFDATLLDGIDLIAISPGLAPTAEPQATLLAAAGERGIAIVGEIELFAWKLAAMKAERDYAPRIVAITGTNGKTTVTRLVGLMVGAAGRRVAVAGNISPAALDALTDAIDRDALPDVWVLELSSFQLATTTSLVPDSATVLNITQDHLDWHGDMDAYAAAKASIFASSTMRVLNRDDARVLVMDSAEASSVRFGLDAPTLPGAFGVVSDRDEVGLRWIAVAEGEDPDAEARGQGSKKAIAKRRAAKVVALESIAPVRIKRLMPVDALRIRGDHNVANVMAALALSRAIGLPMAPLLRAASAYVGEPHRVAFVLAHDGVDWIEDSKGTNVGATVAALAGLGRRVVLIAGGLGKGQDFSPLAVPVAAHARAVVLIGLDKGAIRAALHDAGVPLIDAASLDDAVDVAAGLAQEGDAVLLSPACASLDMFRDYTHRAAVFVAAVQRIVEHASEAEHAPC